MLTLAPAWAREAIWGKRANPEKAGLFFLGAGCFFFLPPSPEGQTELPPAPWLPLPALGEVGIQLLASPGQRGLEMFADLRIKRKENCTWARGKRSHLGSLDWCLLTGTSSEHARNKRQPWERGDVHCPGLPAPPLGFLPCRTWLFSSGAPPLCLPNCIPVGSNPLGSS